MDPMLDDLFREGETTVEYFNRMLPIWKERGVREVYLSPLAYRELEEAGMLITGGRQGNALDRPFVPVRLPRKPRSD